MKVTLVTIRVVGNPMYDGVTKRWLETYNQFKPSIPHDLVVVNCDKDKPDDMFDSVATQYMRYDGGGWDCGTWLFVGKSLDVDLIVCCNTSTYFHREGWMERFVAAAEKFGKGLYGSMGSFEHYPHLRTPCLAFHPSLTHFYPHNINSREKTYFFECLGRDQNFSQWCRSRGLPVKLVTWDGEYDQQDWRKPANIFRRGDQSNILVKDRHVDAYAASSQEGKLALEKMANG